MTDTTYSVTDTRKQLLSNGFTPLPNFDKACFFKSWPSLDVTPAEIDRWGRRFRRYQATGVRIENGLAVIDLDIDDAIADDILDAWDNAVPGLDAAPLRHSGGFKFALFVRTEEPFSRIHSRRWLKPGVPDDEWSGVVEVFGGASPRQFGCFGPHTINSDGEVVRTYQWEDGHSLLDVKLSDLPLIPKDDFFALVDAAEQVLAQAGFEPAKLSVSGETTPERVYDLVGDRFVTNDFGEVSKAQLRDLAENRDRVYLSASWLNGPVAKNTRRCLATLTHTGALAIWDSMTGYTHLEPENDPGTKDRAFDLDRAAELLRELETRDRTKLTARDDHFDAAAKLLETYAFCPNSVLCVVPIWSKSVTAGITMGNFRTLMLPWAGDEVGPRGGVTTINPVDLWASSGKRVTVEGLQLRPDMPRPVFEVGGKKWINTYAPPAHSGHGDVGLWIDFIEGLIPVAEEREWFLDWLAYKFANPAVPGPGVVMVARKFGSGRGTLGSILKSLFGSAYVRTVPFDIVAGKSYQSQYTDWMADSLLVLVNESKETGGSSYATKRDTYERLKELIEPRAEERLFVVKGVQSFMGMSFTSFLIATNHLDALPIPEDDRRISVIRNGEPRDGEFWERLNAWADDEGNIAALAAWLIERGWRDYSPFVAPPIFEAKRAMAEANQSELDVKLAEVLAELDGECFTVEQIVERVGEDPITRAEFPQKWEGVVKRTIHSLAYRVGVRDGQNWHPMFDGRRYAVYCLSEARARVWTQVDAATLRDEVLINGKPGPRIGGSVAALHVIRGGKETD